MARITIIGLGLIGGSLGLAWKKAGLKWEIVGHDSNPDVAGGARKSGAIDRWEWNLPASVEKSDVVVLATPVDAMKDTLAHIAPVVPEGCIITDVGSTKRQVLEWAEELLPAHVSFVGGHPMAGKELSGVAAAEADLFLGRPYCVIPSATASESAIETVIALVEAVGATPFFLDAAEHDGLVAAVSHLPMIVSTALVRATALSPARREMMRLAGSGYRDVSRLASGDPTMHAAICQTNKDNLVRWLDAYIAEVTRLRDIIAGDAERLETVFDEAKVARDQWQSGENLESKPRSDVPSAGEQIAQTLVGRTLFNMTRGEKKNR